MSLLPLQCLNGAAVLGAHFGAPFPAYGAGPPPPPPHTPLLATPRSHHHPHHAHPHTHPHHPASAFYPPPLVYWPYPSPPVSPTTYFSQPGAHSPSQPLYPLDFFPPSPLSPPGVAIPHTTAGLILTPTKATVSFVPGAKQFPGSGSNSNSSSSSSSVSGSGSSKLSVPAIALNGTTSDEATPTGEVGSTQEAEVTSSQTLLSIDTNHAAATPAATAAPPLKTGSQGAGGVTAATPLVTNSCVELYIS